MNHARRAALTAALLLAACGGREQTADRSIDLYTVKTGELRISVREQGEIQAARNTKITSRLSGSATLIYLVPEGSIVNEGDKLVELDVSGFEEKRSEYAIDVAKAESALEQARKTLEIMESSLQASEGVADSKLELARLRRERFVSGTQTADRPASSGTAGTNEEMVTKLRELIAAEALEDANAEVKYSSLVDDVVELVGGEENLRLEMGEMGNHVLNQIETVNYEQAAFGVSGEQLGNSQDLYDQGFLERDKLQAHRLAHEAQRAKVGLAWNDLGLLIRFTLKEAKVTLDQDLRNAELQLGTVRDNNDAVRVANQAELTSKKAEYQVAAERLDHWNQQVENTVVTAPTPGLVVYARDGMFEQPVEEGTEVREGQVLINLPDVTQMVAELDVHESQIQQVAIGQPATIQVDALPGRTFTGKVSRVSALPDSGSRFASDRRVYEVTVTFDGGNAEGMLRPGMSAMVEILSDVRTVINVPLVAVQRQGPALYLWKATPDGPVAVEVGIGVNNSNFVEITDGLDEGDQVYLDRPRGAGTPDLSGRVP